MKLKFPIILLILSALSVGFQEPSTRLKQVINKEKILKADKLLKKYHLGQKQANNIVKVVYFHGNNQDPLPNWRERLTRTLDDVSKFYQEEFNKYGIKNEGIPFEKIEGKYVFHVIKGSFQSKDYTKDSGSKIQNEIYNKTNKQIDFSKDHVLIINGLCDKKTDGTYLFHSPYYGTGSSIRGVCFVADCELLDSRLLTDTIQKMAFSEMAVDYKKCSVAEFNSWYIGGIAHEMGHMFGLPHDFGNPLELDSTSISLMGQYGSRHFREYLWNGKKSSFFSSASILQLMSQPIFTQSNKLRYATSKFNISNLKFSRNKSGLVIKTDMKTEELPYGIVALVRPTFLSEYFNRSFSKFITTNDSLNLEIGLLANGNYVLRLLYLFPNGAVADFNKAFSVDINGVAAELESNSRVVNIPYFYEKLLKMEKTPIIQQKIEIFQHILNPPKPVDPKTCDDAKLFLSDAEWEKASVGWEKVARNYYTCESEQTFFLENQGKLYNKGLFAHSPSSYVFNLNKRWQKFSAIVGLRDFADIQGSARFIVLGDGKILYESPALRVNQQSILSIDVKNVMILELKTTGTEGHNFNSWAVWLNPLLER
ncbi:MAG: NPCBM/NEW2 domain-containing protein [Paludibacter sp.]|nr:NPCBM/NEW2 domain-containing protein [Paludibacter sp.]